MTDNRKVLLSIKDLNVKFRVRGRILTAIRDVSLDIFEDETIAIVGESGCGKSVLTKTFAGMLDNNGFIDGGDIIFNDPSLTRIRAPKNARSEEIIAKAEKLFSGLAPAGTDRAADLAKDIYLSLCNQPGLKQAAQFKRLCAAFREAAAEGLDLSDDSVVTAVFEKVMLRVKYEKTDGEYYCGNLNLNLARSECVGDWTRIRGDRVATIFQDPMSSLNPILSIGYQISSVIMKHQGVSETEAKKRAIVMMKKVGIPNAENRYDDYPFQYSGGMRQRIVIAIALACQPKLLICDEPTTALDVTIQAQILQLIKDLQKEFKFTTVFITHDLGVVANMADRVAVLYAGQIIEYGTAEDIFYDPRHPYTWVLLSSLPQLSERGKELYAITGTPPSLYNKVVGDAFAPRNPYCLKVDTLKEPPMFRVSDTHFAKTWLEDPRSPKLEKPESICHITETLRKVFNI